jgi:hypothetical protein
MSKTTESRVYDLLNEKFDHRRNDMTRISQYFRALAEYDFPGDQTDIVHRVAKEKLLGIASRIAKLTLDW